MRKTELDIISECIESLFEVDMGQVRSAQDDKDAARERKNKAPEKKVFHVKRENSNEIVSSHSTRPEAEEALYKHGIENHRIIHVADTIDARKKLNESESTEVVAKKGDHTLSRITRKDGTGYYKLDDKVKADYPIHHAHSGEVAFDRPGQFPKPVVKWASDAVRKHAKAKKLQESLISEDAIKHQLKIAHSTLKMSDAGASIMGGMSKPEAAKLIVKHKGKDHAKKLLSQSGHSEEEIKKLLDDRH